MGIVSAKSRAIGAGPYDDFIQTDASINPGNSGGPLFNLRGQVVGINTAINPNGKGIGFAIPVDSLKDVLTQLVAAGKVARGRMGVAIQAVDPPLAKAVGLDRPKGALIGEVEPGGPADKAGLRAGDVILRVDDAEVGRAEELPRLVARHAPGSKVRVEYLRERAVHKSEVSLEQLGDPQEARSPSAPRGGGSPGAGPARRRSGWGWSMCPGKGSPCSRWLRAAAPTGNSSGAIFFSRSTTRPSAKRPTWRASSRAPPPDKRCSSKCDGATACASSRSKRADGAQVGTGPRGGEQ